jgi:cytochrome P450
LRLKGQSPPFSPEAIQQLKPHIEKLCAEAVQSVLAKAGLLP